MPLMVGGPDMADEKGTPFPLVKTRPSGKIIKNSLIRGMPSSLVIF